jgi:hypothetical protein
MTILVSRPAADPRRSASAPLAGPLGLLAQHLPGRQMIARQNEPWFLDQDVDTRNWLCVPWLPNVLFGHGQYVPIGDNGGDRHGTNGTLRGRW